MPEQPRLEADLDSYIRALVNQRNNALDAVAQMEGVIGAMRKQIEDLQSRLSELQISKPTPEAQAIDGHTAGVPTAH
jgi:phage shock protein A